MTVLMQPADDEDVATVVAPPSVKRKLEFPKANAKPKRKQRKKLPPSVVVGVMS